MSVLGRGDAESPARLARVRQVVAVEVVKIHPQGVRTQVVRSTAASVGSSVVATRLTGAYQPRQDGQIPLLAKS